MYSIDWALLLSRAPDRRAPPAATAQRCQSTYRPAHNSLGAISGVVWSLGFTSLLTDISSEMVVSVLPLYLVLHLGMSPLAFGVLDGLYQGVAALVRVVAGILSDRWQRPKAIAMSGYALSAACRLLLLVLGGAWSSIAGIIVVDRIGKGVRTAPRDSLITKNSPPALLATSFGAHRALDAAGAMLGPVVAFAVLALAPQGFDLLFIISFVIAVLGVGVIGLFVPGDRSCHRAHAPRTAVNSHDSFTLWVDRDFRGVVVAGALLAMATISDAFVYLMVQRRLAMPALAFPLLYVGTSLFNALWSIPCGRLADRFGRRRVLMFGYAVLAVVYTLMMLPADLPAFLFVGLIMMSMGTYYAATDGVLTAMAASRLPSSQMGTGLALLTTSVNLCRLAASVLFGWVWTLEGATPATSLYLGFLACAIAMSSFLLPRDAANAQAG